MRRLSQLAKISALMRPSGEVRLRLVPLDTPKSNAPGANLSIATNSKAAAKGTEPAGFGIAARGVRSFTPYARAKVRDCAAVLEAKYGTECWFITLTLPGSTDSALRACAAWSAYLMERVRQYLRDAGFPNDVVAVWELQKRGALHMHVVIPRIFSQAACPVPYGLHNAWCAMLARVSEACGVDLFQRKTGGTWKDRWDIVRSDMQKTSKSVARYLSKYISKGTARCAQKLGFYPTRWWSTSKQLSADTSERTRLVVSPTMSISDAGAFFEMVSGTICGASQTVFPIANVYRPAARALSIWGSTLSTESVASVMKSCALDTAAGECYDSATTHDRKTLVAHSTGVFHWCYELMEPLSEDLIHLCKCASRRLPLRI